MAEATAQKKKSGNKIVRFFKELKSELKKVVWPSKSQVAKNTVIVIAAVIIIGIVIWVLDMAFGFGISKLIK
jgi:preprotein translocase subunit SecE